MSGPESLDSAARTPSTIPDALGAELLEVSLQVSPTLGMRDIGARFLAPLVAATGARRASLMLVNPDSGRLRLIAGLGLPAELIGRDAPYRPKSIAEWVFQHRQGLVLNGEVSSDALSGTAEAVIESAMSLPIENDERAIGVLNLARVGDGGVFSDAEMASLLAVLAPVSAALERAMRAQHAEEVLAQLQRQGGLAGRTLLPAGRYEARHYEFGLARASGAQEGGDFCERTPYASGGHTLLAADVAGDGVAAIVTAAFVQGVFVSAAAPERSAAGLVARLNAELNQRGGGEMHASLWIAQLSPKGELASCNAGYPAPFWVPSDNSDVVQLAGGGPPVGLLAMARWDEESIRLLPGDLVVAVSDGVKQARNAAGHAFGAERLGEFLRERRRRPLDELTAEVLVAVTEWSGRSIPADDLSVLALRFTPGD